MKIVTQFLIIAAISFAGELLNYFIPLPVPASIYGLILLFLLLELKIINKNALTEVSTFFLSLMPLFFVPSSVSFIKAFPILKKYGVQFIIIAVVTTILVMGVTGRVTQFIMHLKNRGKK